jgi:UDP-2,3-diacylglucosamine pyrophosphatase LpxH
LKLDVTEQRLLVISDLHLGSPASSATWRVIDFLEQARRERWNICINGDGFDLLQSRLASFLSEALPVVRRLGQLRDEGLRVYYTLGNHDIALEHLLADMPLEVSPFLNLTSSGVRVRIENGHLNEPSYARFPGLYELGGRLGRFFLFAKTDTYELWSRTQLAIDKRRRDKEGSRYPHYAAADALFERGFDAAIFGHTHLPELTPLSRGLFVNGGSWMQGGEYVRIAEGEVTLHTWNGRGGSPL